MKPVLVIYKGDQLGSYKGCRKLVPRLRFVVWDFLRNCFCSEALRFAQILFFVLF